MNLTDDGAADVRVHFETCTTKRAWTGQEWREADPEFHPSAGPTWEKDLRPHLKVLGLTWPTTLDDAQSAFRKLAFQCHPDQGGSNDAFIKVNKAYTAAQAILKAVPMP